MDIWFFPVRERERERERAEKYILSMEWSCRRAARQEISSSLRRVRIDVVAENSEKSRSSPTSQSSASFYDSLIWVVVISRRSEYNCHAVNLITRNCNEVKWTRSTLMSTLPSAFIWVLGSSLCPSGEVSRSRVFFLSLKFPSMIINISLRWGVEILVLLSKPN